MAGPLEGIKILELVRVPPGALCTMMLADMGAEVLKIETPPSTPPSSDSNDADHEARRAAFRFVNRNKRSIAVNLKHKDGQRILHQLVTDADVFVEGFRPGVMARLGGDYETLKQINPRLIYCSLSGFGQNGPYRDLPAHDINYLSIGGVLNLIGQPDRHPAIPLNIVADFAGAAMHSIVGILLALQARHQTGRGQHVDISYLDTVISLLAPTSALRDYFFNGATFERGEGVMGGSYPYYTTYDTADGKLLSVGCTEPWLWENFCKAIGLEKLGKFARRDDHYVRVADSEIAQAKNEVQQIIRQKTRDEWFEFFKDKNACIGPVYTLDEVIQDPQVKARQMFVDIEDQRFGKVRQVGIAIKLSETPGSIRKVGPAIGEHSDEVLAALGYGDAERARLREEGAIA